MTLLPQKNITSRYVCKYCHKNFMREQAYLDHECLLMKKHKELKSPIGQTAWGYYHRWFIEQKRLPPSSEAFLGSKLFRTFINFANFVKKIQLPYPDKFIWYMVQKKYQPVIWINDEIYTEYLNWIDYTISPLDQAKSSVKTILKYVDKQDIELDQFFSHINPNELIQLIRERKLSPWLLLFSAKFAECFGGLSREQQLIMETLIKPDFWKDHKIKYKDDIVIIRTYIKELGI